MSSELDELLAPNHINVGGVKVRKPTAGTLSLCDFAKLKMINGSFSEVPFFEAIAFFYIHSQPLSEVRGKLFDSSLGLTENGCSLSFVNAVTDWADSVELGAVTEMGDTIGRLLTEAMSPKVEPSEESSEAEISAVVAKDASDAKKKEPQPS
jgi:hypothetical protein